MSLHSYLVSQELSAGDPPFSSLIMAAMRKADTTNTARLKHAFPEIWAEFEERYWAPGGLLERERQPATPTDQSAPADEGTG